KEIILEYPDVNITLQIGNVNATVNDHTEVLPEAPVLSPNGVTMVPLRFISETFGATVGYDAETAAITVVKENEGENSTISSSTDLPRIGDSYHGWSMMTPSGMMMTDRYSDGTSTTFEDEECILYVDIYDFTDEEVYGENAKEVFNSNYKETKDYYFAYLTLSKDEKKVDDNGNGYFRLVGRDKEEYWDYYSIIQDRICYEVCFIAPVGSEQIPSLTAVVDSFKLEFAADEAEKTQTHDLSNVDEDGCRLVEIEDMKMSFRVPVEMEETETSQLNLFKFSADTDSMRAGVNFGVYSAKEGETAFDRATEEREYILKYVNTEKVTLSEVEEFEFNGEVAYRYKLETNSIKGGDYTGYAIFYRKGDYNYNINVSAYVGYEYVIDTFIESFKAEELDSSVTGVFIDTTALREETEKVSGEGWSIVLPIGWDEIYTYSTFGMYLSKGSGMISVGVGEIEDIESMSDVKSFATDMLREVSSEDGYEVVNKLTTIKAGGKTFYTFTVSYGGDKDSADYDKTPLLYMTCYYTYVNGKVCEVEFLETELIRGGITADEVVEILASLEIKK
ncbi:MAG: copper amine oxidase N-terminal domain-containing protein, partial [Clostridia bacterium]|nr:copper amine oxidase N-terminal domain-containing protein [Clostridia bacterium]